jgi:DNA-binding GntR family transcriptional regulator
MPFRVEPALHDHYAIVDAINNRDPELAEILMRRHISGAWKIVKNLLDKEKIEE